MVEPGSGEARREGQWETGRPLWGGSRNSRGCRQGRLCVRGTEQPCAVRVFGASRDAGAGSSPETSEPGLPAAVTGLERQTALWSHSGTGLRGRGMFHSLPWRAVLRRPLNEQQQVEPRGSEGESRRHRALSSTATGPRAGCPPPGPSPSLRPARLQHREADVPSRSARAAFVPGEALSVGFCSRGKPSAAEDTP